MRAFDDIEKEIETSRIKELKKFYKQKEDLNKEKVIEIQQQDI